MNNRLLTLPPKVGNKYFFKYPENPSVRHTCEIVGTRDCKSPEHPSTTGLIYESECDDGNSWVFWPDGEAKRTHKKPVCMLVEDLRTVSEELPVSEEFAQLRDQHEQRMARLHELGA